jgi:phage baseplate assembly protein W
LSFDLQILNGDLVLDNGDLSVIRNNDKLIQDLLKIAQTTLGSNPLQPWYGSMISRTLIGSVLSTDITISSAQSQLQTAVETLKSLQAIQIQQGQKVSPGEQIAAISKISITRNTVDPRIFSVVIRVLDKSFGGVAATFNASTV